MRPVSKGAPQSYNSAQHYSAARPNLIANLGPYCSYCERRLATSAEVEHIESKRWHDDLKATWTNFLLACKNCNATKGTKDAALDEWLIPDRDNTFAAFDYQVDGVIRTKPGLSANSKRYAKKTLKILGLNKTVRKAFDARGNLVALDRRTQRMEIWSTAERCRGFWNSKQDAHLEEVIVLLAGKSGFFSIWMAAFAGVPTMRKRFIAEFAGTEVFCFGADTEQMNPHPNRDGLRDGSKL